MAGLQTGLLQHLDHTHMGKAPRSTAAQGQAQSDFTLFHTGRWQFCGHGGRGRRTGTADQTQQKQAENSGRYPWPNGFQDRSHFRSHQSY